jgi:hypothetical protein
MICMGVSRGADEDTASTWVPQAQAGAEELEAMVVGEQVSVDKGSERGISMFNITNGPIRIEPKISKTSDIQNNNKARTLSH